MLPEELKCRMREQGWNYLTALELACRFIVASGETEEFANFLDEIIAEEDIHVAVDACPWCANPRWECKCPPATCVHCGKVHARAEHGSCRPGRVPDFAYRYTDEDGSALLTCPGCQSSLTGDETVRVEFVRGLGLTKWTELTHLDYEGNLVDLGAIASGFHSRTVCAFCDEALAEFEGVTEIGIGRKNVTGPDGN